MINKKVILLIFILQIICGITQLSAGLNDTLRLNPVKPKKEYYQPLVLKLSPTAFLWGGIFPYTSEYRLSVEITSGRTQSEQLSVSLLDKNIFLTAASNLTRNNFKANGWRLQYAHKFYLIRKKKFAPYGLYVGALVSYARAQVSLDLSSYYRNEYLIFSKFDVNGIVGIQVGKFHRVTLDAYAGMGYKKNKAFYHYSSNNTAPYDTKDLGDLYNTSFNGVFGILVGYSL